MKMFTEMRCHVHGLLRVKNHSMLNECVLLRIHAACGVRQHYTVTRGLSVHRVVTETSGAVDTVEYHHGYLPRHIQVHTMRHHLYSVTHW